MKTTFDLADKLKRLSKEMNDYGSGLTRGIKRNAITASETMVEVAKENTPNSTDGKKRGFNVISDSLQRSWYSRCRTNFGKKIVCKVTLENTKPYAMFVQNGHYVKRHFVPWLYKDKNGTISYETNHSQPVFGLIVGTKTKYVKGVDMISPALEAFDKEFNRLNIDLINSITKRVK